MSDNDDLLQAATGQGNNPDQVWADEPYTDTDDEGDDLNVEAPAQEG